MAKNEKAKKLNLRESFEDGLKRGIVSQAEYDRMTACLDLQVSLSEGKSAEYRACEKHLAVASNPKIRDILQEELDAMTVETAKTLDDVKDELDIIGVPIMSIIREGLGKHVSTQKYYLITKPDAEAKEKAESETPNGEPVLETEAE